MHVHCVSALLASVSTRVMHRLAAPSIDKIGRRRIDAHPVHTGVMAMRASTVQDISMRVDRMDERPGVI
jgi:hypothetical protein